MARYWLAGTPTAPSRVIERDAVVPVAELLGVPPCGWAELRDAVHARTGHAVIMHADGGWGAGRDYQPVMQMSFHQAGIDHTIPVISSMAARGELHIVRCDGQTAHIVYWPNCGNLARLTLAEVRTGTPIDLPRTDPMPVPEPASASLLLLGLALLLIWRHR